MKLNGRCDAVIRSARSLSVFFGEHVSGAARVSATDDGDANRRQMEIWIGGANSGVVRRRLLDARQPENQRRDTKTEPPAAAGGSTHSLGFAQ
jgi:hypothetical protein